MTETHGPTTPDEILQKAAHYPDNCVGRHVLLIDAYNALKAEELLRKEVNTDYEAMRIKNGWPTPSSIRHTANALDMIAIPRYGDILRWVADLCDESLNKEK